jgi:Chaperone for flagella basal body P-ring formation
MRLRTFRLVWLMAGSVGIAGACQTVTDDYLRAGDLTAVAPAFGGLNPALEIGIAPLPGIKRVFHAADLLGLARENGISLAGSPAEVCFERAGGLVRTAKAPAALAPVAVKRGDKVAVTVSSGSVVLRFESEAQSSGRPGDIVIVRNPENGNRFAARVEDQGKVTINK